MVLGNPYKDPMSTPERRVKYEYSIANDCIIPLIKEWGIELNGKKVLDLGCGSGGMTVAMAENGANCLGIDHSDMRVIEANKFAEEKNVSVKFLVHDILDLKDPFEKYNFIVLAEVVEHLVTESNVEKLLIWCKDHLTQDGYLYLSFPPWFNPFAGHQAGWQTIRFIPWFHLFPDFFKKIIVPSQI